MHLYTNICSGFCDFCHVLRAGPAICCGCAVPCLVIDNGVLLRACVVWLSQYLSGGACDLCRRSAAGVFCGRSAAGVLICCRRGDRGNVCSGVFGVCPSDQIFPKKAPPSASVSYPTVPRGKHVADLNPSESVKFSPNRTPTAYVG